MSKVYLMLMKGNTSKDIQPWMALDDEWILAGVAAMIGVNIGREGTIPVDLIQQLLTEHGWIEGAGRTR